MSTFFQESLSCSVCKTCSEYTIIGSTNSFGSPDLDLRPAEMQRSTMAYWVLKCPQCGFVAYDIEEETSVDRAFLNSEEYVTCEGRAFASSLAEDFYKIYMIARNDDRSHVCFNALQNAAWACDDAADQENAIHCRKLLLPILEQEIAANEHMAENLLIIKADIMRRAGMFEELIAQYSGKVFSQDILNMICLFHVEKAKQKDDACYLVSDACPEGN